MERAQSVASLALMDVSGGPYIGALAHRLPNGIWPQGATEPIGRDLKPRGVSNNDGNTT